MKLIQRTEPLKKVRDALQIPGTMYGKSIDSISIQVDEKEFKEALAIYGKNMTFKAKLDGKVHNVYIKSYQSDPIKMGRVLSFELHRVTGKETITALIPVHVLHKEVVEKNRYYVSLAMHMIEAEYAVGKGISSIDIDVSNLTVNDQVFVKDLKLNESVTLHAGPDDLVLSIKESTMVVDETPKETVEAVVEEKEE